MSEPGQVPVELGKAEGPLAVVAPGSLRALEGTSVPRVGALRGSPAALLGGCLRSMGKAADVPSSAPLLAGSLSYAARLAPPLVGGALA